MKKTIATALAAFLFLFGSCLTAFAVPSSTPNTANIEDEDYYRNNPYRGTTINVYNWGEYISDGGEGSLDVNRKFEELTGIKVNYTNFDSNEDLYAKLRSGGANYDLIFPSDYMIERLKDEGLLEKLDYSNIPNFKYIDEKYKSLYYDPDNEYTVAYNVGYVALIYNKKLVSETPDSWSILWDKKYAGKILMFNNPRDSFAIAQSLLGQDYNDPDPAQWAAAYEKLLKQKPIVRAYVMDEVYNIMESGAAAMAPYYVGDYFTMAENNDDLAVAFPKEGANIFVDAMCIPTTCQNKGAAELYINFMEEPEVALANAEYIAYATPNTEVLKMDRYTYKGDTTMYPDEKLFENYQYFHNLPPETQSLMSNYWSDLKVDGSSNRSVYFGLVGFVTLVAAYGIFHFARRKHREKYYV